MAAHHVVDISIDHDQLVALNAPREAVQLAPFVEALNRDWQVRSSVPRFAYDVFNSRQIECVLATRPYPFAIRSDGRILVTVPSAGPDVIDFMVGFFDGFFARVPDFVWLELGDWPRPMAEACGA